MGTATPGGGCPVSGVVISMTQAQDSYGGAERPSFTIDVVSTSPGSCAFNAGGRYLQLVIRSGGVRAWGSADCVAGAGSQVIKLQRGVPMTRQITWDRRLSAPGCRDTSTPAQPGTYTAVAYDGRLHSQTLVFVLR